MSTMQRILPLGALLALAACGGGYDKFGASVGSPMGTSAALVPDGELPDEEVPPDELWCDESTPVTLFVSPDDSNSMSSPVQAREAVLEGWTSLSAVPIRTWEFFNYATWDYASAEPGQLAIELQLAEGAAEGQYALQVGITSEFVDPMERDPMNITFAIDQSGSMSGEPMQYAKASMNAIATSLRAGDVVSLVLWSDSNAIVLDGHVVASPADPTLMQAIASIQTGGSTNLSAGLKEAYRLAEENYAPGRINRVLLLSDGGANTGRTDEELIGSKAGANDADGIYMIGVGTGTAGSYNDYLMDRVTDLGRGASVFVTSEAEAQHMFVDRFLETMGTAARDVQIRYDLPPGFEVVKFSGEEISVDPADIEPQHVAPNDSVVLHQLLETCAESVRGDAEIAVTVSYLDGVTYEPREVSVTRTLDELLGAENVQLLKGAAVFAYAEALKAQRGDAGALNGLERARDTLDAAEAANPGDPDLAEIRAVLNAL